MTYVFSIIINLKTITIFICAGIRRWAKTILEFVCNEKISCYFLKY